MYLQSKGEDTWSHTLFEEGHCALCKPLFTLKNGCTQPRGWNQENKELGTILMKKVKNGPKSGHSKICIPEPQERWTLSSGMEVAQFLKSE